VIDNHHYGTLLDEVADDVLLLEWDIAVGKEELLAFADRARQSPDRVLVAPYRIYADRYKLPSGDIWAHRHWDGKPGYTIIPEGAMPISTGDQTCNLFGLGMVYLPRELVQEFRSPKWGSDFGWSNHFGDNEFSMWHYLNVTHDVPVMWEVRPVHLNYITPQIT
jgi:hypothetical protein